MDRNELREKLADLAHEQWSGWMRYMLPKIHNEDSIERWTRQMKTPYVYLDESEQDSDRKEADKFLAVIEPCIAELETKNSRLQGELKRNNEMWADCARHLETSDAKLKALSTRSCDNCYTDCDREDGVDDTSEVTDCKWFVWPGAEVTRLRMELERRDVKTPSDRSAVFWMNQCRVVKNELETAQKERGDAQKDLRDMLDAYTKQKVYLTDAYEMLAQVRAWAASRNLWHLDEHATYTTVGEELRALLTVSDDGSGG